MPIRINLLAEAQALEDLRRRDPVKRAIAGGVILVLLVLAWSISIQLKVAMAHRELRNLNSQLSTRTNEFQQVLANQRQLIEANRKLSMLQSMATNRLLHGTLLNALQEATLDDVQLMRLRTDQAYV
jgi:predicted PurR-regulated permease PerM